MTRFRRRVRVALALAGPTLLAWGPATATVVAAPAAPPPPVQPLPVTPNTAPNTAPITAPITASVVAQAAIPLDAVAYQWSIVSAALAAGAPPTAAPGAPSFMLVTSGSVLVTDPAGTPLALLGVNEALTVPAAGALLTTLDPAGATYHTITLVTGGGIGDAFTPGAATFDVSLGETTLAAGTSLTIPDGVAPALVVPTTGAVTVVGGPAGPVSIAPGNVGIIDGALTITGAAATPATVVVASVGSPITSVAASGGLTIPAAAPVPDGSDGGGSGGGGSGSGSNDVDSDGDGLSDAEEADWGTDPHDADTDKDGLSDGDEVYKYGTSPTANDTDGDGDNDSHELSHGTDPLSYNSEFADADGDGLTDDHETEIGTDPHNGDTDGDGFDDAVEVSNGTDPLDPNSHPN